MTLGKSGAAGAPGCAWEGHNFEENYAVDSLQKQRRVIADTIHDCNPTRDANRFFAIALASVPTLWNKAGTCGRAALRCCGTRPQQRTGNNPDA